MNLSYKSFYEINITLNLRQITDNIEKIDNI